MLLSYAMILLTLAIILLTLAMILLTFFISEPSILLTFKKCLIFWLKNGLFLLYNLVVSYLIVRHIGFNNKKKMADI